MILRKPYAFIIKHFRLIHLIMLACIAFLLYNTNDIYQLFATLQRTNTYTYAGAGSYISSLIYYIIFIVLALAGIVYWLLREKKKPTILYLAMLIYFILLTIGYMYFFGVLADIQENLLELDTIILVRDLAFLFTLPLYVFFVLCFIRGIGFNIKQFNFSKDIEELKIVDKDSAEFELLIGQNNYKYMRTLRRALRETKYYILENRFALTCISVGVLAVFCGIGVYYYNEYAKRYSETELISVNFISYVINKSYITAYDYNGERVRDGFKYVVLDMTFYNSSNENRALNLDLITLTNGKLVYYPTLTKNSKFYDLGVPYSDKQEIKPQEYLSATLTFEIPDSTQTRNFTMRVQYDIGSSFNNVVAQYRNFAVNAVNIDSEELERTYSVNETINSDIVGRNQFSLTITGYSLMDVYDNKYVTCTSLDSCHAISSVISSTAYGTDTMLVVDYRGEMFDDANFTRTFNTYNKVFEGYCTIKYTIGDRTYEIPATIVSKSDVDGKIFMIADRAIVNADTIKLEFDFRTEKYIVNLKSN